MSHTRAIQPIACAPIRRNQRIDAGTFIAWLKIRSQDMCASEKRTLKIKARTSDSPRKMKTYEQAEERLRSEQKRLFEELAADTLYPDELEEGWQDRDSAAEEELRAMEFGHRSAIRERLLKIEHALERLRTGAYGVCVRCEAKINRKRLSREPDALLCVTCQAATEAPPHHPY
jgi:RNA polymerase-binding transcription factor DksA